VPVFELVSEWQEFLEDEATPVPEEDDAGANPEQALRVEQLQKDARGVRPAEVFVDMGADG
jgi:hypothetical protein